MIAAVATGGAAGTRRWFMPIAVLLTGTAWLALSLWEQSPYGRYLDHPRWTDVGIAAALCRALPAGDVVLPASLYAGGWLLMIAAMMLPTALPLLRLFDRMVQPRRDYTALMGLLIAGYSGAVDLRISTLETSCRSAVACSYTRASRQFHAPGLRPAPDGSCARSGSARSGSRMRRGKLDARGGFDRDQVSWATRCRLGACGCFCRMREYRNSRHGRYQTVFECAGKLCRRELGVLQST